MYLSAVVPGRGESGVDSTSERSLSARVRRIGGKDERASKRAREGGRNGQEEEEEEKEEEVRQESRVQLLGGYIF